MIERRRWPTELVDHRVDEVLQLAALFQNVQVPEVYSSEEMDALTDPQAECSWAPKGMLHGPLAFVARSDGGRVIAGVEIWKQMRDRVYYLDLLVRDQAQEYRGWERRSPSRRSAGLSGRQRKDRTG